MMPTINLSDKTAQKLQMLAIPLKDNYDSVIARLVEAALAGVPYAIPSVGTLAVGVSATSTIVSVDSTPAPIPSTPVSSQDSLTHTRLIAASFNGETLPKAKWNTLARMAHERAFRKLGSFDALKRATTARIRQGRFEEQGYEYLPTIDISLQGMDANQSWNSVAELAKRLGVPASADFQWRNNPSAARPGEDGHVFHRP